ncbi:dipeptide/oligopeptide/nickel ABC transporter ATP-binding protein [Fusobacterium polymorphum]|uniref:Peptide ABC transporter ATP-binding protein n=1 Tax=Fusobacterium nucleatum subsp. polymorphum TaxID=76857 RepID=A0A2C6BI20_FUSNP|nr:dipeptide/oligopeptide/nickel ABC transporter ATP-binding protein [Fusobacterium polymorphum]PHI06156.1 peptide ABC transporter ATP-binding protein [Fusobacterium polymorphum]PHI11693.1 peptide ABC transporter ATP-binding protein [Fusobacterium polymorphum]
MLLEVKNLSVKIKKSGKKIVKNISFNMKENTCLGILGESGSGKSTLGRILIGLEKPDSGEIKFQDKDIHKEVNQISRKELSIVFQDYFSSVNPRFKVADIIAEPLKLNTNLSSSDLRKELEKLVVDVGLKVEFLDRYAHELSGGQLQRVCIARAISTKPKFIMLDEAVSSLDISTQVEILNLLQELKKSYSLSYIFVTHDLLTLTYICDSVIFFKEGRIVEKVDSLEKLCEVKDDYSKALLDAVIEF